MECINLNKMNNKKKTSKSLKTKRIKYPKNKKKHTHITKLRRIKKI